MLWGDSRRGDEETLCEQFLDPQNDTLWGRGLKIAGMEAIGAGNIGGAADGTTMGSAGGGAVGARVADVGTWR